MAILFKAQSNKLAFLQDCLTAILFKAQSNKLAFLQDCLTAILFKAQSNKLAFLQDCLTAILLGSEVRIILSHYRAKTKSDNKNCEQVHIFVVAFCLSATPTNDLL
jgi:hypothetical protein